MQSFLRSRKKLKSLLNHSLIVYYFFYRLVCSIPAKPFRFINTGKLPYFASKYICMTNKPIISLAPLQGFTEYPYRNSLDKIIGGVDKYYTPYLRLQNDKTLKKKQIKDILPENNTTNVIPQILVNNSNDFIYLAKILFDFGYKELNLNLGCPYPMVTNRELGAGLLIHQDKIKKMLDDSLAKIKIQVSIKIRTGLNEPTDIIQLLPELNNYSLTEIIIHPRIAKQLYKGNVNIEAFKECLTLSKHPIAYNGDITSVQEFNSICTELSGIKHFMIGRGLLWNPFLALQIKQQGKEQMESTKALNKLHEFHSHIYENNKAATSGNTHLLNKMMQFWSYFAFVFDNPKKIIKTIKKCKTNINYDIIVNDAFASSKLNYNNK